MCMSMHTIQREHHMITRDHWYDGLFTGLAYAQAQFPRAHDLDEDVLTITAPDDDTFGPPNPDVDPMKPSPIYHLPFEPKRLFKAMDMYNEECFIFELRVTHTDLWWHISLACTEGTGVPEDFENNRKAWM